LQDGVRWLDSDDFVPFQREQIMECGHGALLREGSFSLRLRPAPRHGWSVRRAV
jgi:hypothetical protein